MQHTSKTDHGAEADKTVAAMVKKSKSGEGTPTYTPNAPRKIAAAGKGAK